TRPRTPTMSMRCDQKARKKAAPGVYKHMNERQKRSAAKLDDMEHEELSAELSA
ncbi:hypothetical protein SPRG_17787, partial [Saprolegnia parasitica CBS 223.65]